MYTLLHYNTIRHNVTSCDEVKQYNIPLQCEDPHELCRNIIPHNMIPPQI